MQVYIPRHLLPMFTTAAGGDATGRPYRMPVGEPGWLEEVKMGKAPHRRLWRRWTKIVNGHKHTLIMPQEEALRMDRIYDDLRLAQDLDNSGAYAEARLFRRDLDLLHAHPPLSPALIQRKIAERDLKDAEAVRARTRRARRAWRWTVTDTINPENNTPGEIFGTEEWKALMRDDEEEGSF